MKSMCDSRRNAFFNVWVKMVMLVFLMTAISSLNFPARANGNDDACSETSMLAQKACYNAAAEVYNLTLGKCENLPENKQGDCQTNAREERDASNKTCDDQFVARQEVCVALGGGPYNPAIKPANFVKNPIGNLYYPLKPNTTYTYQSTLDGKVIEKDVVKVTNTTREILGVTCRVVSDIVTDTTTGEVTENTIDWYAQDKDGNVWYFGEIAQQFEDGILVAIDGSWTAGVDMAKPGIIMFANPKAKINTTYRTEFLLGEAEDIVKIVGVGETITLSNGKTYKNCLHTLDYSPLDPGSIASAENKYYAPGVGLIKVVAVDGTVEELVSGP